MRVCINVVIIAVFCVLSSCKDATPWAQYTDKPGGFTIFMPGNPVRSDRKVGKQLIHAVGWKPTTFALNKFKAFEVSYTDYPGTAGSDTGRLSTLLDNTINLRKKDFTELDVESQPITINGYPGRAFFYEPPRGNTITTVKECIVGDRMYDLMVTAKKDYPVNEEMSRFFNSFQVLRGK
jgi:hypothetical protein